jgi:LuxR family maltose regulon positive regulatory protein
MMATDDERAGEQLNERELAALAAVARGATRREAAEQLHLSINTVKTHLRTAYRKLGAHDLDEAVAAAKARGLLPE